MHLFPQYLWILGIGVQYHLAFPLSILVFQSPSLGACTIGIFSVWENDCFHFSWMYFYFSCCLVGVCPVFSCPVYRVCRGWCLRWSGRRNVCHVVGHDIVAFFCLALVLYMCNSGTLYMLPSYGCGTCGITSVSSGMTVGFIWGGCLFSRPGFIATFSFLITLWRGGGYGGTVVAGFFVLPLQCCGSGISILVSCADVGDGYCGTAMLKTAASCFIDAVCFSLSCGVGLDRAGFWRASVKSATTLVTVYAGERLDIFSGLVIVPSYWRLVPILYWVCMM